MIDLYPKTCNLCGGQVEYISNERVYGRKYGSGFCYHCTACGSYVGTHRNQPRKAMGILADAQMRTWKMRCHERFDSFWRKHKRSAFRRSNLYIRLAGEMRIKVSDCHFGYFNLEQLQIAYKIMEKWEKKPPEDLEYEPASAPCADCHIAEWTDMYGIMVFACDMSHCVKADEEDGLWD